MPSFVKNKDKTEEKTQLIKIMGGYRNPYFA